MDRQEEVERRFGETMQIMFERAVSSTTAEEVRAWLYEHEHEMPHGVRRFFFEAANIAVQCGAYEWHRKRWHGEGAE